MTTSATGLDMARALLDPDSTFDTPDALMKHPELSIDEKIEILCRWAYDASELAVADEEGMGDGERSQLDGVLKALNGLTGGFDVEQIAPTKHGGFCLLTRRCAAVA